MFRKIAAKAALVGSVTVLLIGSGIAAGPQESARLTPVSISQILEQGAWEGHAFQDIEGIRAFYEQRDYAPAWVSGYGRYQRKATAVLEILDEAWTHGLNPGNYALEEIRRLMEEPFGDNRAALDLLISDAVVRYGQDLTGMRVEPAAIGQVARYWRQPAGAEEILTQASRASSPREALRRMEPRGNLYTALRHELITAVTAPVPEWEKDLPIRADGLVRPGKEHKAIPAIRRRMGVEGEGTFYDDALAHAVMAFQAERGLESDGVIGPGTLALLNVSRIDRIHQIVANLERLRWTDQNKPERYVLVNIPSQILWAVEDGKVVLEMPVIVGKIARPTNSFKTEITGVRFNPNWTVPPTIKRADFLPRLQEDPYYLTSIGIEMRRNGQTLDPATVDWANISSKELHSINMVQDPGDTNPLGKVRVIMDNPYNIYLHDTNKRDYFAKTDRALSSGCIRVAEPEKLADFILSHNREWSREKMDSLLASGRLSEVRTDAPLPVYLLYQTVWQDDRGRIVYGEDLYGQDRKLVNALAASKGIHIPEAAEAGRFAQEKAKREEGLAYTGLNP